MVFHTDKIFKKFKLIMEKNENEFIKFLRILKFYYDLVDKCLSKRCKDIIFRNSFIFSGEMTNFRIYNSVSEIINEELQFGLSNTENFDYSNIMMNFYKKVFHSYYDKCPDLSNYFVKFSFEFLEYYSGLDENSKLVIGKEIQSNFFILLREFENILFKKVK
jgi:hypothetical protein